MFVAKIRLNNFRGEDAAHDTDAFTGFHGPSGSGKSTRFKAVLIALFGSDGEYSQNADLFRLHATKGAGFMAVGVTLSDGTAVDRIFRDRGKSIKTTISISPAGDERTNTEKQSRINALLGLDELPVLTSDLRGRLKDAATRSDFLAALCPTKWSAEEIAAGLGADLNGKLTTPDIGGLAILLESLEAEAKTARASLKEAEAATRAHEEAGMALAKMRRECPYTATHQTAAEEEIGKLNTAIALSEAEATRKATAEAALAKADKELAALPEIQDVSVEAAQEVYDKIVEKKKADQDKSLKEQDAEIKKDEKRVKELEKEQAESEKKEADLRGSIETYDEAIHDKKAEIDGLKGQLAALSSKDKCPKCGYAYEDQTGDVQICLKAAEPHLQTIMDGRGTAKAQLEQAEAERWRKTKTLADLRACLDKKRRDRNKAADFNIDKHPDVVEHKANLDAAKKIDADNKASAVSRAKLTEAKAQAEKTLAGIDVPNIAEMKARRDALRLELANVKAALEGLTKKAASLEESAKCLEKARTQRMALETATSDAKKVKDLRARIIADSLEGFTQAAAGVHVDSKGRTFAVVSTEIRNAHRILVGLQDAAGKFYDYDQLSSGEQLIFASAFIIAVNSIRKSAYRPLFLDDLATVSPQFRDALLERVGSALQGGLLTQVFVGAFEPHVIEGTKATWIGVGAQEGKEAEEIKRMTQDEWLAKGKALYGEDVKTC